MRASAEGLSGARGEVAVEDQFLGLNWGVAKNPREHDLGTDLWLMARDARRFDLGALVGAQAKRGRSWFERPEYGESGEVVGWWYPDTDRHFKYWTEHRVPHILVLHDPDTSVSYWVHVTADKVVDTGKNAKILVPHIKQWTSTTLMSSWKWPSEIGNTSVGKEAPGIEGRSRVRTDCGTR